MPTANGSHKTDILIVGAGPAGLVLACELARRGLDFRLIEQREEPLIAVRGKGVQPRTLEIFEDLGVLPDVLRVGGPYPPRRIVKGAGNVSEFPFTTKNQPTEDIPYPNLLMVPQWRTEAALRARLETFGGRVHENEKLLRFTQDETGVVATVEGPKGHFDIYAKYMIATDGGRSTVRTDLGVGFPGKVLDGPRFLYGDVEIDGLDRDAWWMWPSEGARLTLCPLPHTNTFQLVVALLPDEEPSLDLKSIAALIHGRTGRHDLRLISTGWLAISQPSIRLADRYRVGRILLAGDAAHIHPVFGGQGLNTSIQDAYNLGWKLALVLQGAHPQLLDTYEAERRPVGSAMLDLVDKLAAVPAENQTRGHQTQQLDLNYRGSPLNRELGTESGIVRAGDRAPDARYTKADGSSARLFEEFQGPHFTLLLFGNAPEPNDQIQWLLRIVRILGGNDGPSKIYGIENNALVLVRPDNYIAMLDRTASPHSVAEWFSEFIAI